MIISTILGILSALVFSVSSIKISHPVDLIDKFKARNVHRIKTVNYALKENGRIKIIQVGAKDLTIEPHENWLAKGLWTGDNYNVTGLGFLDQIKIKYSCKNFILII